MKNVVITGANRGIGLELTKQFSEDSFVYAVCRSEFPEAARNDRINVVQLDITDEAAVAEFAQQLDAENVAIDLLINNAGTSGGDMTKEVLVDAATVSNVYITNVVGPMSMAVHLTPALKRADKPVMMTVSSHMGSHAHLNSYNANWWPYSSSKAALSFAVSAFAINEPEITSISLHPGWVKTQMGGTGADLEPAVSAEAIKALYGSIDTLESGKFYNYDGKLIEW